MLPYLSNHKTHQNWLSLKGDFTRGFFIRDNSDGNIVHQVAKKTVVENLKIAGGIPIHPGLTLDMLDKFLTLDMLDKFLKLGLPGGVRGSSGDVSDDRRCRSLICRRICCV